MVSQTAIQIGGDCLVAEYVTIRDQNHRFGTEAPERLVRQAGFSTAPIRIGRNVWIGARACILSGVEIGDNAVIAAGSVVTRDIPANVLAAGIPARQIRRIG